MKKKKNLKAKKRPAAKAKIIKLPTANRPARKAKAVPAKPLSALDAAAELLARTNGPLNAKEMVEQLAAQSLWASPKPRVHLMKNDPICFLTAIGEGLTEVLGQRYCFQLFQVHCPTV